MGILNFTTEKINEILSDSVTHFSDTVKHITAAERTAWDGKASGTHASQHASDGSDPITPESIGAYSKTESDTLLAEKASVAKPVSIGITLADGVTGAARCWRTQDGEVSIHLEIKKATAFSTWEKLATLPEGYRPGGQRNFGLIGKSGGVGVLSVYTDGSVTTNTYIGSGIKEILFYGSFIASD